MRLEPGAIVTPSIARPTCFLLALFSVFVPSLQLHAWSPVPVDELYPPGMRFHEEEPRTRTTDSLSDTDYMPDNAQLRRTIGAFASELDERIVVESARIIPIPSELRPDMEREEVIVAMILRSISSMEGIEYYSERRNEMRTLFARSFLVDGPNSSTPIDDPRPDRVPSTETVYAIQEDLTFGENRYRITYNRLDDALLLSMRNETRMSYGIIPALGEHRLNMFAAVIPVETGLLFYGAAAARVPGFPGLRGRIGTSFENRVNAISEWFVAQLANQLRQE